MNYHHYQKWAGERLGLLNWAPHWEIVLTHDRPDGQSEGEYGRSYFLNRHVRPQVDFNWGSMITRDSLGMDEDPMGCHVSGAATQPGTGSDPKDDIFAYKWSEEALQEGQRYDSADGKTAHQRDWDILEEAVGQAYRDAGVNAESAAMDRIRALVDLQNKHKGEVHPSRHPVDTLLHSSYCTGAANLFVALCMVAGFPARTLNNAIHSMAEVWNGEKWLFVDNLTEGQLADFAPAPGRRAEAILNHNYLEVLLGMGAYPDGAPLQAAHGTRYTEEQPYFEPFINLGTKDWRFNHGRMGLSPSLPPKEAGVGLFALPCPDNIKTIYPEWDEPLLLSRSGRESELSLTPRQGWLQTVVRVDRGLGLCKSFYVGALDDGSNPVRSARADLHISDSIGTEFNPSRGGWVLQLNGRSLSLKKGAVSQYAGVLSFDLPVQYLQENAMNKVELYSEKSYPGSCRYRMPDTLAVTIYPDGLGTELPWYGSDQAELYTGMYETPETGASVCNTHSGWVMVPQGI